MFSKYFLTFCSFALFVAIVSSSQTQSYEGEDNNVQRMKDSVEARNPGLAIAVKIIKQAFKWAAKHCLKQAAKNCKQHWKHPKALIRCARAFLKANKGRCVVG